jgi:hypothetical protein
MRRCQVLRLLVFIAVLLAVMIGVATTAGAWSEGQPPESVGTHDQLVIEASEIAATYGKGGNWVDMTTALTYSHYPDEVYNDSMNHIYDVWGLLQIGSAPSAVKTHFDKAVTYLKKKNVTAASMEVGLMAHYYDDIWNPWHTNYEYSTLGLQSAYHTQYEDDVLLNVGADFSVVADGFDRVTDAAAATRAAASTSHSYHWEVFSGAYTSGVGYAFPSLDAYTRDMLSKSANGLADLIYSIKLAAGTRR